MYSFYASQTGGGEERENRARIVWGGPQPKEEGASQSKREDDRRSFGKERKELNLQSKEKDANSAGKEKSQPTLLTENRVHLKKTTTPRQKEKRRKLKHEGNLQKKHLATEGLPSQKKTPSGREGRRTGDFKNRGALEA